jgi:3-hydroxyisobutyrate dehydrogenase-like beta-hydroxyacid dehydrogenase
MNHKEKPEIAFLGIGLMGLPMARNLLKQGYSVHAWNRTKAKAEAFGRIISHTAYHAGQIALILKYGK